MSNNPWQNIFSSSPNNSDAMKVVMPIINNIFVQYYIQFITYQKIDQILTISIKIIKSKISVFSSKFISV